MIRKIKSGKYRLHFRKKNKAEKRRDLGTFNSKLAERKTPMCHSVFQAPLDSVL